MQRSRVADKSRTRVQVEDRKTQLILCLIGPVSVERVRNGMGGPGNDNRLRGVHRTDLCHQAGHGAAVDDLPGDATAQPGQRRQRCSQRLRGLRTLSLRVGMLCS